MLITVKYFGTPIANLGTEAKHIELPAAATIEQLLCLINEKLEDKDRRLLEAATFMVNKARADRNTELKHGDEVLIMHSLAGG
jgi:molybdopterin converting factor small subunit